MSSRCARSHVPLLLFVVALFAPGARAQKMEKEDKKWLDEVRPLMLPAEEKTYKGLKDKADRLEFQKIFWARRDPDLDTPENEFESQFISARADADTRIKVLGAVGSQTDCGRALILLGKPDEVKKEATDYPKDRTPETWVYRDRSGQTFQGGKAEIAFDETCKGSATLSDTLNRVAEQKIVHPNIGYRMEKDHLVKLADLLPKPTAAQALLKTPRQDFPLSTQANFVKMSDGGSALLGLVHGDAAGVTVADVGGKKTAKVVVAAHAIDGEGKVAAFAETPAVVDIGPDGAFVASYRMQLKPGKYTLEAGALDEKNGKGSLAKTSIEVPSFNDGQLSSTLIILRNVEEVPESAKPDLQNPYSAFELGHGQCTPGPGVPAGGACVMRLVPYFGQAFSKTEALSFFYQYYDAAVDPATGGASGIAAVTLLKEGKTPVAKAPEQPFDTPVGGTVVGPVSLTKYEPGKYVVQLKITDKVAKKDRTLEVPFDITP
jgi:GWxTD domain-containing protein